jgi:hypothetical protein
MKNLEMIEESKHQEEFVCILSPLNIDYQVDREFQFQADLQMNRID